jgi:hypothetical protein
VDLQAYGGNPPGQHRMLPTFGHPELSIHPAGSPLPGLAAGTSKLFVLTCKRCGDGTGPVRAPCEVVHWLRFRTPSFQSCLQGCRACIILRGVTCYML